MDIPGEDPVQGMTIDIGFWLPMKWKVEKLVRRVNPKLPPYISDRFKEIGLKPAGTEGYYQPFSRKIKGNPHATEAAADDPVIYGKNVIALLDNKAANTIVIGAHFDHLGYGKEGSLYTGALPSTMEPMTMPVV